MVLAKDAVTMIATPGGNSTGGLATPQHGAREVSVIVQRQEPGGGNPSHRHDREEVLLLRAGKVRLTIGDEQFALAAGDTAIVPANTLHQIENSGDTVAEWLLIAPAGVRFFRPDGEENFPEWAR